MNLISTNSFGLSFDPPAHSDEVSGLGDPVIHPLGQVCCTRRALEDLPSSSLSLVLKFVENIHHLICFKIILW